MCEQDKILKDLEARISSLKEDKVHALLVMWAFSQSNGLILSALSLVSLTGEMLHNYNKY